MIKNIKQYLLNRKLFEMIFERFDFEILSKIILSEDNNQELSKNNDSFIVKLLIFSLEKFRVEREEFIDNPCFVSNKSEIQVYLYLLIKYFNDYWHLVFDEIEHFINSEDEWVVSVGFEMLNDSSERTITDKNFNILLENMSKYGVNESPYNQGIILAEYLKNDYKLFDEVFRRFDEGNEKFIQAVLKTFSIIKGLPIEAEILILSALRSTKGESRSVAAIAAGNCRMLRKEAISLLRIELMSDYWYMRGNALYSLGLLKIKDEKIVNCIIKLLNDDNGNDWSVSEMAILALGLIGKHAYIGVNPLLDLLRKELHQNDTEYKIALICQSLAKIDHGSSKVINILIEVVSTCQFIAIPSAIKTLTQFKYKSKNILPYLKKYVNQDDYLEEGLETDMSSELLLLECLHKIGGNNEEMLHQYIDKLKNSEYEEERKEVETFLLFYPNAQT